MEPDDNGSERRDNGRFYSIRQLCGSKINTISLILCWGESVIVEALLLFHINILIKDFGCIPNRPTQCMQYSYV